jgi:hypothetical protein
MALRVFDRAGKHETAPRSENEGRAFQDRRRCLAADGRVERELAGDRDDTRVDALGVGRELPTDVGTGSIGADQDIAFCDRSIVKVRNDTTVRRCLEGSEGLAEADRVFQTLEQDLAQGDAADRPSGLGRRLIGLRKPDGEQTVKLVVEKGDGGADLGRRGDISLEGGRGQTRPKARERRRR